VLNQKIRGAWDIFMKPVGRGLMKTGVSPDAITIMGVAIQGVSGYLILEGRLFVAGLVAIVAALFDALDSAVAKARNRRSSFGALLDSTTDRLSDALFFLPLIWLYGVRPDVAGREDLWVVGLAMAALVFSFLVSYVKARAEGLGLECNVGFAERLERLAIMIIGLLLGVVLGALVILVALSAVTFLQRLLHVRKQASLRAAAQ
jgi:CDP-diacylglycerol--glycerol-3-phosphate 3-phosphatidyltransferase